MSDSTSLFNVHELWGIAIASIYFLIGFPTNLLSIIVCCKSLTQRYFAVLRIKRKRKYQEKDIENSLTHIINTRNQRLRLKSSESNIDEMQMFINSAASELDIKSATNLAPRNGCLNPCTNNQNLDVLDNNKRKVRFTNNFDPYSNKFNSSASFKSNNKQTFLLETKSSSFSKHNSSNSNSISRSNPHRKCFELYLIQISICDLIIIGYNFCEWTLLILSRYNLIDPIYMEPVLISKFMCRFIIALNRCVILLHNWLVASLALTRCYAIYNPLNSTTQFSTKFYYRLNLTVLAILVLAFSSINIYGVMLLSYNSHSAVSYTNMFSNASNSTPAHMEYRPECRISKEIYEKYKYIEAYINITLGIIGYSLPCFITLIINLVLIYNLRHMNLLKTVQSKRAHGIAQAQLNSNLNSSNNNSPQATNQNGKHMKNRNQFFKATGSLLTLSFSYLICYIPYSFMFLLLSLDMIRMNGDVIFGLTCLRYLNHTLNFYIYFLTGKKFRNDVIKFLGFGKKV